MGKEKYIKTVLNFFEKTPVVTSKDIKLILNKEGIKKSYPYLFIHKLVKSGRIKKITKGFYTIHDDPIFAVFCFKPAYIGLQDSLSFHNLWEQESNVVIITGKKVRNGIRNILGSNVVLKRIKTKYIFGYDLIEYDKFFIPVSDIEKTLIDFVYFKEHLDKDILKEIKKRAYIEKIKKYLRFYPKRIRKIVLKLLERN